LLHEGRTVRTYRISLGRNPSGRKEIEGDGRTPEGRYIIDRKKPDSFYHLALHVSYPSAEDRKGAVTLGVKPGGDIMIHGIRNGLGWIGPLHRLMDWSAGCIAVTNREIEEISGAVPVGTEIRILP